MDVCRPAKPTCRWLKEISHAIHRLCPDVLPINQCHADSVDQWHSYLNNLNFNSQCRRNPKAQQILRFEIDIITDKRM